MDPRRMLSWVLLVAGGLLLVLGVLPIVAKILGASVGSSIIGEIKLATDLNPWLEKLLLTVIGAAATAIYLKFNLSLSWNKQLIGMSLIGGIWTVTFGFLAWTTSDPIDGPWFTTDGKALRCYVLDAERVRLLYKVERDPRTGALCREVTEGIQRKLRDWLIAQRDAERRGEKLRLRLRPVASPEAYFGFSGDPLVWYYRKEDGTCDYFDIPGFHPEYQDELKPITKEARTSCAKAIAAAERHARDERERLAKQDLDAAARKATDDRRAVEAQRDAARAQARADKARARYERYVGTPVSKNSALVATADLGELALTALDVVRERGHTVLLKSGFTAEGMFESVWNGGGDLAQLGVDAARGIVLLRPVSAARVTRTVALEGLTFVRQEFSVLLIRPAHAFAAQRHGFVAEGRAFSDVDARAALRADFAAKLRLLIAAQL